MITYLLGLCAVVLLPRLEYLPLMVATLCPLLVVATWRRTLLLFLLGASVSGVWGAWQLAHRLPNSLARTDVEVVGQIDSLVEVQSHRQRFILSVDEVNSTTGALKKLRRINLSFYATEPLLKAGDRIQARVRLFPVRGLSNPHAYDIERAALVDGLDARGYIRQLIQHSPGGVSLAQVRQSMADRLDGTLSSLAAGTLKALVLGTRTDFESWQWELLASTGTSHLMVVSGLHVAVLSALGFLLARLIALPLGVLGVGALSRWRVAILLSLVFAVVYAALAGMGVPVQRALLMVAVFLGGEWMLQPVSGWTRWRWALVAVLSWQPLALLAPGAWLSFTAVALLLWIGGSGGPRREPWRLWGRVQVSLFVGMLPLSVGLFNRVVPLAPIINLVAIPIVSLFVLSLPALLPFLLLYPADWVVMGVDWVVQSMWLGLQSVDRAWNPMIDVASPVPLAFVLCLAGLMGWFLPGPSYWRWAALALILPLLTAYSDRPEYHSFQAQVFDVGQGLAMLVETENNYLMYDTGPGYRNGGSAFSYTVAPTFDAKNLQRLDWLVISHSDSDHAGGVSALLKKVETEQVLAGQPGRMTKTLSAQSCHDKHFVADGVSFRLYRLTGQDDNGSSCVMVVRGKHCSLVVTGDLGRGGERALLTQYDIAPVTWLVAGHHGSNTSSGDTWLDALEPSTVIVSRGRFNHFGHPHPEVLARVKAQGANVRDTALEGALRLSDRPGCPVAGHRAAHRRYWQVP
ncbi:MAG: DNA internalization-related competence protein ComEC/Rec2 [Oceanospirillaceae bacterium]|nr:DNA internalization-related competence protein ComEC/Rec2 [Oceanospirillaceae bacterium]